MAIAYENIACDNRHATVKVPWPYRQLEIRRATAADYETLTSLWLRSVRATHTFLTEGDIASLLPEVNSALRSEQIELWVCEASTRVIGFMGLTEHSLEALFLEPDCLRSGVGRTMVRHAVALKGELTVDVNEQNPAARRFYESCGFVLEGRSERDNAGRPFPVLHMRRREGPG